MSGSTLIIEKLQDKRLLKEVERSVWKIIKSAGLSNRNTDIKPGFGFYFTPDEEDFPKMGFEFGYTWDINDCGISRLVGDYLVFGIDLNKVNVNISKNRVKSTIESHMSAYCSGRKLSDLLEMNYDSFYAFCVDYLYMNDGDVVSKEELKAFLQSDYFYSEVLDKCISMLNDLWEKQGKPLKGIFDGAGDDILPVVICYLPDMSCYYIKKEWNNSINPSKVKLDFDSLVRGGFERVSFSDFARNKKIGIGMFVPAIKNGYVYKK